MPISTDTEQTAPSPVITGEQEPVKKTRLAQLWSLIVLPFLAVRLLLLLVGVITIYYVEPLVNVKQPIHLDAPNTRFPDMLWLMWSRFDSGFYLEIAHHGYWGASTLHGMSNWAFFPLYPVLIHIFAFPFATNDSAWLLIAIAISNISALAAAIYLYKLTEREFNRSIAMRAVWYLILFPMSYYLSAIYPEALFMALTLGSVYYARERRWWLAGLLGGFAALTRPQGVLMVVVVGWEYWQYLADRFEPLQQVNGITEKMREWLRSRLVGLWRSLKEGRTWVGIAALLQIPLGLGIFCLYGKWKVGTFFPFQETERYGWYRSFTNPLKFLYVTFTTPRPPGPYDWNFYGLGVVVIVAFILALIPIFRKLPAMYGIFALLFVLMPLTTGATNSIARYYMEIFPVYMVLAWWTSRGSQEQQGQRHSLVIATFAILLALATILLTLGVYSMS